MSNKIEPLARDVVELAKYVGALVRSGLSRDEVLARIAHPAGVAAGMIDRAVLRRRAGEDYLGAQAQGHDFVLMRVSDD